MKTIPTNDYIKSFNKSGFFIPFILFALLVLANNITFWVRNFIDYDWRYFHCFLGGCSRDIFIFSFVAFLFGYLCKHLPFLKKLCLTLIHFLFFLPILDYFYYRATLERFNWIVLQFINYHSTIGFIGNMGGKIFFVFLIIACLLLSIFLSCKKEKFVEDSFFKPLAAFCIFTFFASLFTTNTFFQKETNFTGHIKTIEGKNRILKDLSYGSIYGFFQQKCLNSFNNEFKPYTSQEKKFLEKHGLLPIKSNGVKKAEFDRVIMIVLESFALEYMHSINPDIPAEASPYFDYLMANYPHLNNFHTSDFPTLQGLNAMFSSKIPFNQNIHDNQKYNIASLLEKHHPNSTWFIRGASKYYGNEIVVINNIFNFSNFIGYEELAKNYEEPKGYVWGYNDFFVFNKAFNSITALKKSNYFMVIKLLNQHQPIISLSNSIEYPKSISSHKSDIVKSIYESDRLIKQFIELCKTNNILDEKTLLIITSDHYPPLGYGHTELVTDKKCHFQLGKLPLIFVTKKKDIFNKLDVNALSCQLDLAPTLCELLGLEIPNEYIGQSLLSTDFNSRSIGIMNNESLYFQSENMEFVEKLDNPATSTIAIKKWINNLTAFSH